MTKTVLITGAAGSLAGKIRAHCLSLGWRLVLLDRHAGPGVIQAELSHYDPAWTAHFAGVDTVIHLAANAGPNAQRSAIYPNNIASTESVLRASKEHGVRRVVFASSNWVMAGYRFGKERLTCDLAPRPLTPYGLAKLEGERMGAASGCNSFIALRIGYCQPDDNKPGAHMHFGSWGQLMWLSDRDLCNAIERSALAENVPYAVLNLMSDNPGMRWDIEVTKKTIGYAPKDGAAAMMTDAVRQHDKSAEEHFNQWLQRQADFRRGQP